MVEEQTHLQIVLSHEIFFNSFSVCYFFLGKDKIYKFFHMKICFVVLNLCLIELKYDLY